MPAQTVSSTVTSFAGYLSRRGRASNTRVKYLHHLAEFGRWAGGRDPSEITTKEIEINYLGRWFEAFEGRHGRTPAPHTVRLHIGALKSYSTFLERCDRVERHPIRRIAPPRRPGATNDSLAPREGEARLAGGKPPHERIAGSLVRFSGLRIGEARALRNRDVDVRGRMITVRISKTPAGRRVIPPPSGALPADSCLAAAPIFSRPP